MGAWLAEELREVEREAGKPQRRQVVALGGHGLWEAEPARFFELEHRDASPNIRHQELSVRLW